MYMFGLGLVVIFLFTTGVTLTNASHLFNDVNEWHNFQIFQNLFNKNFSYFCFCFGIL